MKILIAEDDPISRLFLEKTLEKLHYDVTPCKDGAEAWNTYLTFDYRIVISDWMMPEIDGLELCKRIRRYGRPDYCYFMMLTAKATKADFLEAMDAGADDYLTKPLDQDEIAVRLRVAERFLNLLRSRAGHQTPRGGFQPRIFEVIK